MAKISIKTSSKSDVAQHTRNLTIVNIINAASMKYINTTTVPNILAAQARASGHKIDCSKDYACGCPIHNDKQPACLRKRKSCRFRHRSGENYYLQASYIPRQNAKKVATHHFNAILDGDDDFAKYMLLYRILKP